MTHVPALRVVGLESKIYLGPSWDIWTAKMVGEVMLKVQVLYLNSALGVSNLGGTFSALLQIDQDLHSPWESPR